MVDGLRFILILCILLFDSNVSTAQEIQVDKLNQNPQILSISTIAAHDGLKYFFTRTTLTNNQNQLVFLSINNSQVFDTWVEKKKHILKQHESNTMIIIISNSLDQKKMNSLELIAKGFKNGKQILDLYNSVKNQSYYRINSDKFKIELIQK